MKQKIEWYKEVLEIEPNSKIFFPLARMLTRDGRPDEAIIILRQGVGRHPDHVEARLFLAELLYSSKKVIELQQEIDVLSVLFKNYPGFWRAWGERLFDEDATRDAGLAAIFMAAFLQNLPVSWAGVIEHGLKSLVGGESLGQAAAAPEVRPLTAPDPAPAALKTPSAAPVAWAPEALLMKEGEPKAVEAAPVVPPDVLTELSLDDSEEDETEEPITLRTRSMAEILAEQDDLPGALDIYNELLAASTSDAEKKELRARIDALSGNASQSAEQGEGPQAPREEKREEKKDWLAILAQRLEARSLQ